MINRDDISLHYYSVLHRILELKPSTGLTVQYDTIYTYFKWFGYNPLKGETPKGEMVRGFKNM